MTKLAYLCSQYPAVSHTFINREIEQLRANHIEVHPFSMRLGTLLPGATEFEKEQYHQTWVIHKQSIFTLLKAPLQSFLRAPLGVLKGLWFALKQQKGRPRESLWALFHFLEATILTSEMRRRDITHLHVHFANAGTAIALYATVAFGITYSFTLHGPDVFYNTELGNFRAKLKHAAFIITISHFASGQVVRMAGIAAIDKIERVHCGVDTQLYVPAPRRESWLERPFTIVCTGRLTATKGQALLLRACARLAAEGHSFTCYLIGGGEDYDEHDATIQELAIASRVKLTGPLAQQGVRDHLIKADLFVLPSFAEGVPVVLMEAMSMEIPCLTTRVGGIAELIEHGRNGWLNHSGDLEGLTQCLREIMDHPECLQQLGRAARQTILQDFEVRQSGERLANIFKKRLRGSD